jgi:rhodanese-related sulfurtransferase
MQNTPPSRRLIDVRQPREFASGHLEGSELIPLASLPAACQNWDRCEPLTIVCRSGRRAQQARSQLTAKGFTDVFVLPGGVEQWRTAGKPLVRANGTRAASDLSPLAYGLALMVSLALAHFLSLWFLLLTRILSIRLLRRLRESFRRTPSTTTNPEGRSQ